MVKLKTKKTAAFRDFVRWSDSYAMGIKVIDEQHKGLLDFVNELFAHSTGNVEKERAWFKDVIQQAVDYINAHFSTEERFMKATFYPGYAEHKKAHDEFTHTVINAVKDFESGRRLVLEKFAYFLRDWILTHVAVMDKQYTNYFRKIAIRNDNGKLIVRLSGAA